MHSSDKTHSVVSKAHGNDWKCSVCSSQLAIITYITYMAECTSSSARGADKRERFCQNMQYKEISYPAEQFQIVTFLFLSLPFLDFTLSAFLPFMLRVTANMQHVYNQSFV